MNDMTALGRTAVMDCWCILPSRRASSRYRMVCAEMAYPASNHQKFSADDEDSLRFCRHFSRSWEDRIKPNQDNQQWVSANHVLTSPELFHTQPAQKWEGRQGEIKELHWITTKEDSNCEVRERFYHNKNQIFFNKSCCYGPLLDPDKVSQLRRRSSPPSSEGDLHAWIPRPKLERYLKRFCRRTHLVGEFFLSLKPVPTPCPDQCQADGG
ncbi:hypothetical protein OS493_038990 [Desmophyllum pertusum]|uniref:Uncharacterized protein n=1 Tax=Desmophyllum pertusum TaxID=174260 RepID=A0A9X0D655_9CNID|nr:hypothetical protein OS493_038990 [Desmophyllum pertusum]